MGGVTYHPFSDFALHHKGARVWRTVSTKELRVRISSVLRHCGASASACFSCMTDAPPMYCRPAAAVARGRDSFRLALQLCGWNRTVSDIYRLESNRCCYVGKCGSAVEGGPSYSRPGPSRRLRFLADGSADDPPLSRRHSDRHPRDRVSGLRDGSGGTTESVGELASQHFSDTVQRGFSRSAELGILPDCAHDLYYGLRGHDGYADWSVGTRGISG